MHRYRGNIGEIVPTLEENYFYVIGETNISAYAYQINIDIQYP